MHLLLAILCPLALADGDAPDAAAAPQSPALEIQVIDEGGLWVPGVQLSLGGEGKESILLDSDVHGQARFDAVTPGTYSLFVEKGGFVTMVYTEVEIGADAPTELVVELIIQEYDDWGGCGGYWSPPAVDTERAWRGYSFDKDALERLPR